MSSSQIMDQPASHVEDVVKPEVEEVTHQETAETDVPSPTEETEEAAPAEEETPVEEEAAPAEEEATPEETPAEEEVAAPVEEEATPEETPVEEEAAPAEEEPQADAEDNGAEAPQAEEEEDQVNDAERDAAFAEEKRLQKEQDKAASAARKTARAAKRARKQDRRNRRKGKAQAKADKLAAEQAAKDPDAVAIVINYGKVNEKRKADTAAQTDKLVDKFVLQTEKLAATTGNIKRKTVVVQVSECMQAIRELFCVVVGGQKQETAEIYGLENAHRLGKVYAMIEILDEQDMAQQYIDIKVTLKTACDNLRLLLESLGVYRKWSNEPASEQISDSSSECGEDTAPEPSSSEEPVPEAFQEEPEPVVEAEPVDDEEARRIKHEKYVAMLKAIKQTKIATDINGIADIDSLEELLSYGFDQSQDWHMLWMVWMVQRVHLNDPTLEELSFAGMEMPNPEDDMRVSPKLAKAIAHNTYLRVLDLWSANMLAAEGVTLGQSLAVNQTIEDVNVEQNSLDSESFVALAQALKTNRKMHTLRLQGQKGKLRSIKGGGAMFEETLSHALPKNEVIRVLAIDIVGMTYRNVVDTNIMRNVERERQRKRKAKMAAELLNKQPTFGA